LKGAILLDALGTLVDFEDPVPLLRAALAERHGVHVTEEQARAAVRAEIATYRAEHGMAGDAAGLTELRRRCADVVRDTIAPAADGIPLGDLAETLVVCFRFAPYPEVPGVLEELRARGRALAVVSNWDVSLHGVLERTRLRPFFGAVVVSA
jgi:FMN phosphatase YigB (HAD superfamily)